MKQKNNIYTNLLSQADKIRRHNRQGSYKTRTRYFEAYQRFLRYLADEFRLQKIQNISGKHLSAYVNHLQDKGLAASTLKTDLSALRFWHDQVPNAKYALPPNSEFNLERRQLGKIDRTWTKGEYERMIELCESSGKTDFAACIILARNLGLRIHECLRIDTAIARNALKTGTLTIRGKNGLERRIQLNEPARLELEKILKITRAGSKIFVSDDTPTHTVKSEIQAFIRENRKFVRDECQSGKPKVQSEFQSDKPLKPLSFHGLRHSYAVEIYRKLRDEGKPEYEAKRQVSKLLGHRRSDVTNIYLASLRQKDGEDNV